MSYKKVLSILVLCLMLSMTVQLNYAITNSNNSIKTSNLASSIQTNTLSSSNVQVHKNGLTTPYKIISNEKASSSTSFISQWDTTKTSSGSSASNQISLPLVQSGNYNFNVSWGDGQYGAVNTWNSAQTTHTYATAGNYTVTISGTLIGWSFYNGGDKLKIMDISQWGTGFGFGNTGYNFYGSTNLQLTANDAPILANVTNLEGAFLFCSNLGNKGSMNTWDTSSVKNMYQMFEVATTFNQPISKWDTSSVTDMSFMFMGDHVFNQPIGGWNVSQVTNMDGVFEDAQSFNQPLNSWDVSNVQSFIYTFNAALVFNQNISNWDMSSALTLRGMFDGSSAFNQPVNSWNVSSVTDMTWLFWGTTVFNQSLNLWDVSSVTNMSYMFYEASNFNQNLGNWNVTSVQSMISMFTFDTLTVSHYDALLIGWAKLIVRHNVVFGAGNSKYSSSAVNARGILTNTYAWIITDGGLYATSASSNPSSVSNPTNTSNTSNKASSTPGFEMIMLLIGFLAVIEVKRYRSR